VEKRGLRAEALGPESISAGHITALANTRAKLVCLSYLGLGTGAAHIRYLVRRLRRILPEGVTILVAYWDREEDTEGVEALLELVEADAYATTLHEAVELCVHAAKGELEGKADAAPAAKPKPTPKGKKTPASAA
jgi:hypothetical protein